MGYHFVLKKNSEFRQTYSFGKSFANRYAVLYVRQTNSENLRIGFSVSKRVGGAVVRNRIKRLFREYCRLNYHRFTTSKDVIIIARNPVRGLGYYDVAKALEGLFSKAKLLSEF